ncbi:hypothetical protein Q1695_014996 [Nippostrongylus brasiliensis]|nr:hypothetical protein Q1695_014996 [Nippostrongylus brasiliensis]
MNSVDKVSASPEEGEPPRKCAKLDTSAPRRIVPILDEKTLSEVVPLTQFYVVKFEDKTKISEFLKKVPLTCTGFEHLKRVDKTGRVLVQQNHKPLTDVSLKIFEELGISINDVQVVDVPSSRPLTSKQFDWAKNYWPTSFHPDKELEALICGTTFSEEEKAMIYRWSDLAADVGCIVVQNNEELARGSRTDHLLGHPVITMVQNLSQCQRRDDDYLATGCDVYLREEPCAMCAMALVHCRASKVFYSRNTQNGVLAEGKWQIQFQPAINHHYNVFHVEPAEKYDVSLRCAHSPSSELDID